MRPNGSEKLVVDVKFIGSFRSVTRKSELELKLRGSASLRLLVTKVVERLPELKSSLVNPASGEPKTNMLVLVNGREISVLEGSKTVVTNGDQVVFVPIVHGG